MNKANLNTFIKSANHFMRGIKFIVIDTKTGIAHLILCETSDLMKIEIARRAIKDHFPPNDKKCKLNSAQVAETLCD